MKEHGLEIYVDGLREGGAEYLLLDLLPTLKRHFADVTVVALRGASGLEPEFAKHTTVSRVSLLGMIRRMWRSTAVAHVNLARPQAAASIVAIGRALLGRADRSRIVCHEHASFDYYTGRRGSLRIIDGLYRRLIMHCLRHDRYAYIVSTAARRAELSSQIRGDARLSLIPNSVSAARMRRLSACRDFDALTTAADRRLYRFFTLSRLHAVKQLDWAIDAVAALAAEMPECRFELLVCGKGPERPRLERYAAQYGALSNLVVGFPGFVDALETPAATAHCFLLSSRTEGFPVALTEAVLTGITAVSTDCPHGPAELAASFANLRLASPPTRAEFVRTVRTVFLGEILSHRWHDRPAQTTWPTSEETGRRLAAILHDQDHDPARRSAD